MYNTISKCVPSVQSTSTLKAGFDVYFTQIYYGSFFFTICFERNFRIIKFY